MNETHVVLMSGGLDSSTVAALALSRGASVRPLLVDYGQRHRIELSRAKEIARLLGCHKPQEITLVEKSFFGGGREEGGRSASALTDERRAVPKDRTREEIGRGVPATYVPARNLVLLSLAFSYAERVGADAVGIGVNALDYSGYPDCRPAFIQRFAETAPLATACFTERGKTIRLEAPLLEKGKAEILALARSLGVPVERTWSCYDPQGPNGDEPCGRCDSCILRAQAEPSARA